MNDLERLRELGDFLDKTLCLIPDSRFINGEHQKCWMVMDWHVHWTHEDVFERPMGLGATVKAAISDAISKYQDPAELFTQEEVDAKIAEAIQERRECGL